MGIIYSRAELTIQAVAGSDPERSLFAKRSQKSQSEAESKCKYLLGIEHSCFVRGPLGHSKADIIDKRGWALQESLLSPRLLGFGTTEIPWECRTLYWNKSGRQLSLISAFQYYIAAANTRETSLSHRYQRSSLWSIKVKHQLACTLDADSHKLRPKTSFSLWRQIAGIIWLSLVVINKFIQSRARFLGGRVVEIAAFRWAVVVLRPATASQCSKAGKISCSVMVVGVARLRIS